MRNLIHSGRLASIGFMFYIVTMPLCIIMLVNAVWWPIAVTTAVLIATVLVEIALGFDEKDANAGKAVETISYKAHE